MMDTCILNAIHIFYANKEKKQTVHYNFIKALGHQLVDQALNTPACNTLLFIGIHKCFVLLSCWARNQDLMLHPVKQIKIVKDVVHVEEKRTSRPLVYVQSIKLTFARIML